MECNPSWLRDGRVQEEADKTGEESTLSDLSAYLLLSQASSRYGEYTAPRDLSTTAVRVNSTQRCRPTPAYIACAGFDYAAEGLSADEAGRVARLFARYDLNDDGRLDLFELTKLA